MAKTVSSSGKSKAAREKEKAEKAKQKEQVAADKERVKQQKEAEKVQAAAAKAAKAAERARIEAEREKLRKEKEEVRMERERLQVEREKERMARDKEKSEKEREKSGKEKAKKEKAQEQERLVDRSRNLLSAFLGVTHKPTPNDTPQPSVMAATTAEAIDSAAVDGSSCPTVVSSSSTTSVPSTSSTSSSSSSAAAASPLAPPQPLFHPFQLKPNSSLAPLHRLSPASTDEIDFMTQQHSPASICPDYPSLASPSSASSAPIHSVYSASVVHRCKRMRSLFYCRPSRRSKLIQHCRTFRPPFYGYLPNLPTRPLSACFPFALQSTGVNYEVDSDEEWGEEPEGEELGEDEEEDEEGDGGKDASRGQLRRDGYEEDGDFTVPEDEDEALLMGGLMAEARVMEKGGKKRIVIRPIVVGPWHTGDAVTAEVAELRRRTQWKWCRPLTRDVVKRAKEVGEERDDKNDTNNKTHKRKSMALTPDTVPASSDTERTVAADQGVRSVDGQSSHSGRVVEQESQPQGGDCFTPTVKKKVKRTIVPQLTSTPTTTHTTPIPTAASAPTPPILSQLLSAESARLDAVATGVTAMADECVVVVSEAVMDVVDAEVGRCTSGSELEVSELELTTELSCSETGTCSDMLTSELSTADGQQ